MNMEIEAGQEFQSEATEVAEAPEVSTESNSTDVAEANPFWGEVEKATGPNVYRTIKPHLDRADTAARERVTALNQSYAPWKALADQGITPDHVNQSLQVVQRLNDPEGQVQIFESLQTFLRENGRLPNQAELQEQVEEDAEEQQEDPRIAQLSEQQQAIMQFLQGQQEAEQNARINAEADSWADAEWNRITKARPDLSKEDLRDVAQVLAAQTNQGQEPNLDNAVAAFTAMRDRIRTTPRPGQSAPRIPSGPGGGTPNQAVDPSTMTQAERRELVANMLQRNK